MCARSHPLLYSACTVKVPGRASHSHTLDTWTHPPMPCPPCSRIDASESNILRNSGLIGSSQVRVSSVHNHHSLKRERGPSFFSFFLAALLQQLALLPPSLSSRWTGSAYLDQDLANACLHPGGPTVFCLFSIGDVQREM